MTDVSVLVDSRGGNTRKVADAIAEELGIKAADITKSSQMMQRSCSWEVERMAANQVRR